MESINFLILNFCFLLSLATMHVYRDFFAYQRGIYKHSAASRTDRIGFHSVRLVGWGEERDGSGVTKYWVICDFSFEYFDFVLF